MSDRDQFDAALTAETDSSGRPAPFTATDEASSFMSLMGTTMPGRAG